VVPTGRMTEQWETRDRQISYACPGFEVVTDEVVLPDGRATEFDHVAEGESVVVLALTGEANGDVVVIEEWRQAVGRVNRGLPAGGLEAGEAPAAAARRELREETGYEAGELRPMTTVEPANGFADTVFHYFLARDCEPTAEQDLDRDETIAVGTAPFDDLLADVRDDRLRDGRAAFAVTYHALFGDGGE
jgi:ADP-ribose pyrophosphatase